ncbi:MAG: SDR family NAD(P)-dependent oxidoreductase [Alphaproteobacteria bacterium]
MKLSGRTALVTGASRGIGRAIARAYAGEGAAVVVTGRDAGALETLAAELGGAGHAVVADLAAPEAPEALIAATLERFGGLDVLVNNAGIIHAARELADFAPDDWRTVIEVNLVAPAMLARAAVPAMRAGGGGHIINVSSIGGRKGARGRSAYRASKAALINLTESLAAELAPDGIQVNCICPGAVDTEGYRDMMASRGQAPLASAMRPEEIAELALFLATDAASAVTGTAIDAFGATNPLFQN